ncbi:MAG: PQQ-binding-like beta-propeller repeat protein [Candidatus Bathyarchaeia archaeon]
MQFPSTTRKAQIASIILAVLLSASFTLVTLPIQAQTTYTNLQEGGSIPLPAGVTPDVVEDTRAFLSFTPNPIGVGQTLLVNMWLNPALHVSRYFKDYTVTITKPDGTKETIKCDSYRADATAWFPYVVDQVGTWKFKFEFPGGYFPAGNYTVYEGAYIGAQVWNFPQSVYYKPSSTPEQTLIVQQDIVYSWPDLGLPTDYWTRPASLEHREWWPILGGFPGTGYVGGGEVWDKLYPDTNPYWNPAGEFHPWVQGPNTAHIVWKRLGALAGLIGGPAKQYGITSSPGNPSVVYAGRCYQTMTVPINGVPTSCAVCYDLRTGEQYYAIPTAQGGVTPSYIAYVPPGGGSVPGAEAQSTYSVELLSISGGRLMKINPFTGAIATNVSISPLTGTGGTYYMNQYVLAIQDLGAAAGAERYRLINWTTAGTTTNFTARIISNTTYARSSLTASSYPTTPGITYAFNNGLLVDFNVGLGATVASVTWNNSTGIYEQMRIQGFRLSTGEALWDITVDEPQYSRSCYIADHGKVAVLTQKGYWLAYDLATGKLAWQSEQMDYPWSSASFGAYAVQSAYGMLFRQAYDGVYAFNWTNGKIVWKYKAPALAAFETPYIDENGAPVYSFNAGAVIADGKMYVYNTEHTPSWPMTRGWGLHCINITTGELIWKIGNPMVQGAVADGYLTAANTWDGYMYVFGKGKSATTVTASPKTTSLGEQVLIEGTVLDMSPAQPGTPCVSKESMSLQMEYLHLQRPIGGIWNNETITGVPVTLTAIDSNGKSETIGTVTTNGYYGTFSLAWKPPSEGTYTIIASFAGDESYSSSGAATAITVGPAPTTAPTPEPPQAPPDYTWTIVGTGIAVILAVAIVGVLILRKKQ